MKVGKLHYPVKIVIDAWSELNDRERDILIKRVILKQTQGEVAETYSISTERVRQIEEESLKTLTNSLEQERN